MIRALVDFALENRFLVLAAALLLFGWGAISFHQLPVEAYPDVADNYVEIITQWPGISAEQIEQQVTIPLEIVMNGIPHVVHLRSFSLFGLSDLKLIFDDEEENAWNRERVLERLSQVTLPPGVAPQMGTDWSPVGQIYFFTLHSTNPQYDVMELKSLEDWVVEKNLKAVPDIVDVASFGGPTREYQVRVDPNKLIAYGLSLAQVEQQLTNNNVNAGGSFIEAGLQQINVREVGLVRNVQDIENTVITTKNGTPLRVKDIAVVAQGPKIRLGQFGRAIHREDGKIIDNDDVVSGIVLLRKGANADEALAGIHAKVKELNDHILPAGVKIVPFIDRSDLVHFTTHTVLHNLTEGIILVVIVLFLFLGNVRGALIVALTIPFSLLFAATCLNLKDIPANLLSLGALDFGMVVDGAVVMVENIVRHLSQRQNERSETACWRRSARPRTKCSGRSFTPSPSSSPRTCRSSRLQRVEGRLFKPMAWTVAFALLGALLFSMLVAPVLSSFLFRKGAREWHNPVMDFLTDRYRKAVRWAIEHRCVTVGRRRSSACVVAIYLAFGGVIGSEFLPHLDEGALWVRGTLAPSTGPTEGIRVANQARVLLCSFPEVPQCTSQVGRPDDGTDTTGFFNTEYFVDLKPKEQWRPVFHQDKDELIAAMDRELDKIPGVVWGFSQPIEDNMEEAVSGVKGELATKIYGDDLKVLEDKADQIVERHAAESRESRTSESFACSASPTSISTVDREQAARYQINVADVQDAIQTAVGGNALTQVLQGEARYDLVLRYLPQYRTTKEAIENIRLLSPSGERVSLAQLCKIEEQDGGFGNLPRGKPALCRHQVQRARARPGQRGRGSHQEGKRAGSTAARVSHRLGRRIREREARPGAAVPHRADHDPGDFLILYTMFRSFKWAVLILATVAMAQHRRLAGAAAHGHALQRFLGRRLPGAVRRLGANRRHHARIHQSAARARAHSIEDSAIEGAVLRLRPIMMTMLVATLGLLPAALSHAIGSDSQRPFAIVIVGGLMVTLAMSIFLLPTLYVWFAREGDKLPDPEESLES